MKKLLERERALCGGGQLECPRLNRMDCGHESCAHYNPDTQECIYVEAAQAQVAIAESLRMLAGTVRVNRWGESSIMVINKGL